jgi:hypothetical protein
VALLSCLLGQRNSTDSKDTVYVRMDSPTIGAITSGNRPRRYSSTLGKIEVPSMTNALLEAESNIAWLTAFHDDRTLSPLLANEEEEDEDVDDEEEDDEFEEEEDFDEDVDDLEDEDLEDEDFDEFEDEEDDFDDEDDDEEDDDFDEDEDEDY